MKVLMLKVLVLESLSVIFYRIKVMLITLSDYAKVGMNKNG